MDNNLSIYPVEKRYLSITTKNIDNNNSKIYQGNKMDIIHKL
ncbi:MAG: hypothetical protein BAJALOKI1v1_700008 [Promethearchaeota archaeon]|nr:MAG: hypothetical protein BAJALOKI1v1_700008 [Candidatus Lokiarchaeota archaeon]